MMQSVCGTAAVRISTQRAEYPHRSATGVDYPVGRFTSYLSGVELLAALEDGVVESVHEFAAYQPGYTFRRAGEELIRLRAAAAATSAASPAPAAGVAVRAGFLFDVPVRFAEDRLEASRATFLAGEVASVPLMALSRTRARFWLVLAALASYCARLCTSETPSNAATRALITRTVRSR